MTLVSLCSRGNNFVVTVNYLVVTTRNGSYGLILVAKSVEANTVRSFSVKLNVGFSVCLFSRSIMNTGLSFVIFVFRGWIVAVIVVRMVSTVIFPVLVLLLSILVSSIVMISGSKRVKN